MDNTSNINRSLDPFTFTNLSCSYKLKQNFAKELELGFLVNNLFNANTTVLMNGSTYYATQTVNGLESVNRLAVTVTINTAPNAPSSIIGPLHFCANSLGQTYSIGSVPGATSYVWTVPTGSTGSSTNNNISLLFNP